MLKKKHQEYTPDGTDTKAIASEKKLTVGIQQDIFESQDGELELSTHKKINAQLQSSTPIFLRNSLIIFKLYSLLFSFPLFPLAASHFLLGPLRNENTAFCLLLHQTLLRGQDHLTPEEPTVDLQTQSCLLWNIHFQGLSRNFQPPGGYIKSMSA